jgi:hypothetical protein
MMDRLREKKKEAIEQFTALEPVGRMAARGNRQCCSMDAQTKPLCNWTCYGRRWWFSGTINNYLTN